MTKRDLSNQTIELNDEASTNDGGSSEESLTASTTPGSMDSGEKKDAALSDNISLFQSLRVLQEGEEGDDHTAAEIKSKTVYIKPSIGINEIYFAELKEPNETCLKTSILSTLSAGSCVLLCILTASLLITCSKLRHRKKDAGIYDAYINHKGQID